MRNKTVYISSTYDDLIQIRSAAFNTLTTLGYRCKNMEHQPAVPGRPLAVCLSDVENSDIYVGLFAWRYGSIPDQNDPPGNPLQLSFTEFEYQHASFHNKPRYIFLLNRDTPWSPNQIDHLRLPEPGRIIDRGQRIEELRKKLEKEHTVNYFSSSEELCKQLTVALGRAARVPRPPQLLKMPEPLTSIEFVGRSRELDELEKYLRDGKTAVVVVTGEAGMGKSHLVKQFLDTLASRSPQFWGAQWTYAWSFYNQDTRSVENSSSEFLTHVLRHYGFKDWHVSDEQRATKLAELLRNEQSLVILDAVDPLQETSGSVSVHRAFRDAAMRRFIEELCDQASNEGCHYGLVIITCRTRFFDDSIRRKYARVYHEIPVGALAEDDSCILLGKLLPSYNMPDLIWISQKTEGQPLALGLLGGLLAILIENGVLENPREQTDLFLITEQTSTDIVRRVLTWYHDKWTANSSEDMVSRDACLSFLRALSLFSRPMSESELEALVNGGARLASPLSDANRALADTYLKKAGLLVRKTSGEWDTHSAVRRFFGEKLYDEFPDLWKEAHYTLWKYFRDNSKQRPETADEMEPVARAIHHGCLSGRYDEAYVLYRERAARDFEGFITENLGLVAWDLTILSRFFPTKSVWDGPTAPGLDQDSSTWLRSRSAYCLELVGRLGQAKEQRRQAITHLINTKNWEGAADGTEMLALLETRTGDLEKALDTAIKAVEYARSAEESAKSGVGELHVAYERLIHSLTVLGAIYHRLGQYDNAKKYFDDAERKHQDRESGKGLSTSPVFLHSEPGSRYCVFLLDEGLPPVKLEARVRYMEAWAKQQVVSGQRRPSLLISAMHHLTKGRFYVVKGGQYFGHAAREFDSAIKLIKQAHNIGYQCQPLLARADLKRRLRKFDDAVADLQEVLEISGEMILYKAQAYLMRASILLTIALSAPCVSSERGEKARAAQPDIHLAESLVQESKYWLRSPDLRLLKVRYEYCLGMKGIRCLEKIGEIEAGIGANNYRYFRDECVRVREEIRIDQLNGADADS
jgi:tetratricopeptide (TPR) repeat protein